MYNTCSREKKEAELFPHRYISMNGSFDLFIILFNLIFIGSFLFIIFGIIRTVKTSRNIHNNINSVIKTELGKRSTNTVNREAEKNSHASQAAYSQYYSQKPIKDSGVKDMPLSEAEKNVIYGK